MGLCSWVLQILLIQSLWGKSCALLTKNTMYGDQIIMYLEHGCSVYETLAVYGYKSEFSSSSILVQVRFKFKFSSSSSSVPVLPYQGNPLPQIVLLTPHNLLLTKHKFC